MESRVSQYKVLVCFGVLLVTHVVDAELDEHNQIIVHNLVSSLGPATYTVTTARAVGVLAASEQLVLTVLDSVDVAVAELGTLVVEAGFVRQDLLERRGHDLVSHRLSIDRIPHCRILDLVDSVYRDVGVVAATGLDHGLFGVISVAVLVEVIERHGVGFVVDQTIRVAFQHGVDTKREDVLMMRGKNAGVDDGTPRNAEVLVDWLCGENASSTNLIHDLSSLVELKSEDVLVVGNSDDALDDKLTVSCNGSSASSVVCVLPEDAIILFVNADSVGHGLRFALVIRELAGEVVDRAETITAQLEIVGCEASASISEVESRLLVEWVAGICIRDVHV